MVLQLFLEAGSAKKALTTEKLGGRFVFSAELAYPVTLLFCFVCAGLFLFGTFSQRPDTTGSKGQRTESVTSQTHNVCAS